MTTATPGAGPARHATLTAPQLGDELTRLVWESFSDLVVRADPAGIDPEFDPPEVTSGTAEELLIFLFWAHTHAARRAFHARVGDELIRSALDAAYAGLVEDLQSHGLARERKLFFERRLGSRFAQYNAAAQASDESVGRLALAHFQEGAEAATPGAAGSPGILDDPTAWVVIAEPFRDFLSGVELREGPE